MVFFFMTESRVFIVFLHNNPDFSIFELIQIWRIQLEFLKKVFQKCQKTKTANDETFFCLTKTFDRAQKPFISSFLRHEQIYLSIPFRCSIKTLGKGFKVALKFSINSRFGI